MPFSQFSFCLLLFSLFSLLIKMSSLHRQLLKQTIESKTKSKGNSLSIFSQLIIKCSKKTKLNTELRSQHILTFSRAIPAPWRRPTRYLSRGEHFGTDIPNAEVCFCRFVCMSWTKLTTGRKFTFFAAETQKSRSHNVICY